MERSTLPDPARIERRAYAVAVLVLVIAGTLLRSIVLNWIVGPGLVVVVVVGVTRLAHRREVPS